MSSKPILIGLTGLLNTGKDTVGDYLVGTHLFKKYAFADPLRRAASEMFGIPYQTFMDRDTKEVEIPFWGYSPRQILQKLGTEGGRELFASDLWVKRFQVEWNNFKAGWVEPSDVDKALGSYDVGLVVSDVRFENEADIIRNSGGVLIHVTRPIDSHSDESVTSHASEAGVKIVIGDVLLENTGTIDELYEEVDVILSKMLIDNIL